MHLNFISSCVSYSVVVAKLGIRTINTRVKSKKSILMNDLSNQKNNEQAELNLIDLESMLRLRLLPGMSINEVSYRLGNNYKILAQTKADGLIWEKILSYARHCEASLWYFIARS